jgi:CheY-like chemotaxis protein
MRSAMNKENPKLSSFSSARILSSVLIVDDDVEIQNLVKTALRKQFKVYTEDSGAEVISRAETLRPDLILLDLTMPHIDGFEVLEQFRNHPALNCIPIICLSADNSEEQRERARKLGAASFLSKPIDTKTLADDIQHLVDGLSSNTVSIDGSRRIFVGFNASEKYKSLKEDFYIRLANDEKIVLLSLTDGQSFFADESGEGLIPFLRNDSLIYLQVRPSMIVKIQYMENLDPFLADLRDILGPAMKDRVVVVDDPDAILNLRDPSVSNANIYALIDVLSQAFSETHFFCVKPRDPDLVAVINQMSRIFAGAA